MSTAMDLLKLLPDLKDVPKYNYQVLRAILVFQLQPAYLIRLFLIWLN
jgi:hypothetical protein